MTRQAYTSIVTGWPQVAIGLACTTAVVTVSAVAGTPAWAWGSISVLMLAVVAHLSMVRLGVGTAVVTLRQGPWPAGPARVIPVSQVTTARRLDLSWAQALGIGIRPGPLRAGTMRLTVRAGPALELRLRSGEVIRISTPDPDVAGRLLSATSTQEAS